jgi:hypothetical protein
MNDTNKQAVAGQTIYDDVLSYHVSALIDRHKAARKAGRS